MVLKAYPEAAREKDRDGRTPLHRICGNERASLEMLSMVLKAYPEAARENFVIRDDIKELFRHLSSLFEENNQSNPSLQDITTYFINTSWWNGVWLGIDRHPSIAKSMKLQTTVMADFLFTAGKRLSLASMTEVIKNEPDLLEGV